jgi:7-carboxy-7-deazaguanine synthase
MHGQNPIRPPVSSDGSLLDVKHIFPTLQGEGMFTGHPAVFIRLGGCNLACSFCDTDFEDYAAMPVPDILAQAGLLAENEAHVRVRHLIVITGGEPLRQNIAPLCEALLAAGFTVQVETNGTLWRPLPEAVHIVCSPKNTGQGYFPVREDLLARVDAFKFIISQHDPKYDHVPDIGQHVYGTPVYVQPMDEYDDALNAQNRAHALHLAQVHGYILSLQTHKLLGIE